MFVVVINIVLSLFCRRGFKIRICHGSLIADAECRPRRRSAVLLSFARIMTQLCPDSCPDFHSHAISCDLIEMTILEHGRGLVSTDQELRLGAGAAVGGAAAGAVEMGDTADSTGQLAGALALAAGVGVICVRRITGRRSRLSPSRANRQS